MSKYEPKFLFGVCEKANFLPTKFRNTLLSKITVRSVHELPRCVHLSRLQSVQC